MNKNTEKENLRWILASRSPRRKELFKEIVPEFTVLPAVGEETAEAETPEQLVELLARQKAEEIAALPSAKGAAVLGADTVVSLDGKILGKPKDEADAIRMLSALSGRTHEVFTGVCLILRAGDSSPVVRIAHERTEVKFEKLSEKFIREYVASGSPMDKAGGYGIQDGGLVREIKGSYSNVVGLPVELLKAMIKDMPCSF